MCVFFFFLTFQSSEKSKPKQQTLHTHPCYSSLLQGGNYLMCVGSNAVDQCMLTRLLCSRQPWGVFHNNQGSCCRTTAPHTRSSSPLNSPCCLHRLWNTKTVIMSTHTPLCVLILFCTYTHIWNCNLFIIINYSQLNKSIKFASKVGK